MRGVFGIEVIGLVATNHNALIWPVSMAGKMSVMKRPRLAGKNASSIPQKRAISSRSVAFSSVR